MEIQYQWKWLQQLERVDTNRIPEQVLNYKPGERRNIGHQKKRWKDQTSP